MRRYRKGQKVTYRSGYGFLYSAIVQRAHRDGSATVQLYFPLDDAGRERVGCFQGDKFRVGAANLVHEAA